MATLKAFVIDGFDVDIKPSRPERDWMDASDQRYAYRCLPLTIANCYGWDICVTRPFTAIWNGGSGPADVVIETENQGSSAVSHFGSGIITFHVPIIFRTEPDFDLVVQGPVNVFRDGIAPLCGVVETNWAPFTFTMNWKLTRPDTRISFGKGDPFCQVYPIRRRDIEEAKPQRAYLSENPTLEAEYKAWSESRNDFNAALKDADASDGEKWQKHYHQGRTLASQAKLPDHRTKLRLCPFMNDDLGQDATP